jgi:L-fuculose-phosphate aldolase
MDDIVTACKKLYDRGLVANHDGNITYRNEYGGFIATPTSFSKGDVTKEDLLTLNENGQVVHGKHRVFSEIALHLAIYKVRPDIRCVVHAHPPTASAFALAGQEIGTPAIAEAIVSLGRGILNAKSSTSEEFARVLSQSDAFLIPGNGAWTVGETVMQTYYRMELVEHIALQHFKARQLGTLQTLPLDQVNALLAKRPKPKGEISKDEKNLRDLVAQEVRLLFSQGE